MKTILFFFFASVAGLFAENQPMDFARLETTNGKVYEQVKVRKIDPDGIAIMHDAGLAKVMFENLPKELQTAYGFDPVKAIEHRKLEAQASRNAQAQQDAAERLQSAKAADAKSDREDEAIRNRVRGMGRLVQVDGYQIADIGLLANIRVMKPVLASVPGSAFQKDRKWVFDTKEDGVIQNAKEIKAGEVVHFYPNGVKPWSEIKISWEGPAWRIGFIRYKTRQGLLRTCPLFTALEDDAVKFYKQHGFTQAAVDAVLKAD